MGTVLLALLETKKGTSRTVPVEQAELLWRTKNKGDQVDEHNGKV
jgi:hypothetical protein